MKIYILLILVLFQFTSQCSELIKAITSDGRRVILKPDGTWAFLEKKEVNEDLVERRRRDAVNLKDIGLAIRLYSEDNHGNLPPDLWTLVEKKYLNDPAILISPGSKTRIPADRKDVQEGHIDYVYFGQEKTKKRSLAVPLIISKPELLDGKYINIYYSDGKVLGFYQPPREIEKLLQERKNGVTLPLLTNDEADMDISF